MGDRQTGLLILSAAKDLSARIEILRFAQDEDYRLRDAISIENRYFTSDRVIRSYA